MNPEETRKDLENELKNFSANQEHYEMMMNNLSKMMFMRYKALIEVGFSEQQAFEIIKHRGLN